ncbi:MAG TPA: hypothetical protein VGI38_01565 [Puia sp.]|jgi:hypothetical protein
MKKKAPLPNPDKTEEKGVFYRAGEVIGSIGFHIVDGKEKLIEAVSEEFIAVKRAIKKKLAKKKTTGTKSKKISKKKSPQKATSKISVRAKQLTKKTNPAKAVKKKADKVKRLAKSSLKK